MAVTALRKLSSNNQKRQSKQNPQTLMPTSFSRILDEADKRQQQSIQIRTSGYTRDAQSFYNCVSKREYSQ